MEIRKTFLPLQSQPRGKDAGREGRQKKQDKKEGREAGNKKQKREADAIKFFKEMIM